MGETIKRTYLSGGCSNSISIWYSALRSIVVASISDHSLALHIHDNMSMLDDCESRDGSEYRARKLT